MYDVIITSGAGYPLSRALLCHEGSVCVMYTALVLSVIMLTHEYCFVASDGEVRHGRGMMNFEFTFDLFVSAAILTIHRDKICLESDAASLYGCMNR